MSTGQGERKTQNSKSAQIGLGSYPRNTISTVDAVHMMPLRHYGSGDKKTTCISILGTFTGFGTCLSSVIPPNIFMGIVQMSLVSRLHEFQSIDYCQLVLNVLLKKLTRCNSMYYFNSFFLRTSRLRNSIPIYFFHVIYDLENIKYYAYRQLLST